MRCCRFSTCGQRLLATSREVLAALLGKDAPNLSPAVITRLTAEWQADYDAWQKRELSARRYVYVWADGLTCRPEWKKTLAVDPPPAMRGVPRFQG